MALTFCCGCGTSHTENDPLSAKRQKSPTMTGVKGTFLPNNTTNCSHRNKELN
jgi:hypothetical protein